MSSLVSWLAILTMVVVALVMLVALMMGRVVADWCGGIWWEAEVQQHQATNRR